MKIIGILIITGCLAGCGAEGIANKAGTIVGLYCAKSQTKREAIRTLVASQIAPNEIEIRCEGDQ